MLTIIVFMNVVGCVFLCTSHDILWVPNLLASAGKGMQCGIVQIGLRLKLRFVLILFESTWRLRLHYLRFVPLWKELNFKFYKMAFIVARGL